MTELRKQRLVVANSNWKSTKWFSSSIETSHIKLDIYIKGEGMHERVEKWIVSNCFNAGNSRSLALEKELLPLNLVPLGSVAALINHQDTSAVEGKICCGLPMVGGETGLPVHINACFEISKRKKQLFTIEDSGT